MNTYGIFIKRPFTSPKVTDSPILVEAETFVEAIYKVYQSHDVAQNQIFAVVYCEPVTK